MVRLAYLEIADIHDNSLWVYEEIVGWGESEWDDSQWILTLGWNNHTGVAPHYWMSKREGKGEEWDSDSEYLTKERGLNGLKAEVGEVRTD